MSRLSPGASAFPCWNGHPEDSEPGIDTLAYFAARAPQTPQWDFEIVGLRPRPKCLIPASKSTDGEPVYEGGFGSILEWERERDRMRLMQWPWVWASAVLRGYGLVHARQAAASDVARQLLTALKDLAAANPPCSAAIGSPGSPARDAWVAHVDAHNAALAAIALVEGAPG